uniref:Paraneoplastic antigen Ma-like C-terminal domain-containing protein n=1 Tax=Crocodylus porosus TaxID=8502 RepID=A0A7M4F2X2_CROPO
MDMAKLLQWCTELQVSPGRVIVITNIPKDFSAEAIWDLLRGSSRCLRLCQVHGVCPDERGDHQMAVCKLTTAVDTLEGNPKNPPPEELKTLRQLPQVRAPDPEWAKALGKVLKEALQPSPESVAYKRLCIFSGKDPLPAREETFEAWHSHVTETLASWAVSEEEKRRWLLEMQTEALFLEFNKTYQQKGETASAYILQLEKVLQQLVVQGGLTHKMAGKACLQQLWVGILYDEQLVRELNFTGRREDPPTFGQLLQEIREAESLQAVKASIKAVAPVPVWGLAVAPSSPGSESPGTPARFPPGLVGPKAEVPVVIEGRKCIAVLRQWVTSNYHIPVFL